MNIEAEGIATLLRCPVCDYSFNQNVRLPVLICASGHTICRHCFYELRVKNCPFDRDPLFRYEIRNRCLEEIMEFSSQSNQSSTKTDVEDPIQRIYDEVIELVQCFDSHLKRLQNHAELYETLLKETDSKQIYQYGFRCVQLYSNLTNVTDEFLVGMVKSPCFKEVLASRPNMVLKILETIGLQRRISDIVQVLEISEKILTNQILDHDKYKEKLLGLIRFRQERCALKNQRSLVDVIKKSSPCTVKEILSLGLNFDPNQVLLRFPKSIKWYRPVSFLEKRVEHWLNFVVASRHEVREALLHWDNTKPLTRDEIKFVIKSSRVRMNQLVSEKDSH